MAKIISCKGKIPKRIGDTHVVYPLNGDYIVREKTGFESKALLKAAKYANCRRNASEFGRISRTCKGFRLSLEGLLPRNNKLDVVNSLTKHMRSLLVHDFQNGKGNRLLQTALEHSEGKRGFVGYDFNPATTIAVSTTFAEGQLRVHTIETRSACKWMGFRLHVLAYDWEAMVGDLYSGCWHFEQGLEGTLRYTFPKPGDSGRGLIYLLEVQYFEAKDGEFFADTRGEQSLVIVGVTSSRDLLVDEAEESDAITKKTDGLQVDLPILIGLQPMDFAPVCAIGSQVHEMMRNVYSNPAHFSSSMPCNVHFFSEQWMSTPRLNTS